jgi:hypothetical protein
MQVFGTPALQSGAQGLIQNSGTDISEALLSPFWHMLSHILKYVSTALINVINNSWFKVIIYHSVLYDRDRSKSYEMNAHEHL